MWRRMLFSLQVSVLAAFLLIPNRFSAAQVFELTLQNFDQFTKDKDVMLVEFFAPW